MTISECLRVGSREGGDWAMVRWFDSSVVLVSLCLVWPEGHWSRPVGGLRKICFHRSSFLQVSLWTRQKSETLVNDN